MTDNEAKTEGGVKSKNDERYTAEQIAMIKDIVTRAFAEAHAKVEQELRVGYITPDMPLEDAMNLPFFTNGGPLEMIVTTGQDVADNGASGGGEVSL